MWLQAVYGFLASLAMIAPIFVFGFLIAKLNRTFYRLAGKNSRKICYATGIIGTPIHELSHASMCLVFGHKIKEIKLFQVDSADGVLGYVRHSYNKTNLYQRIGNFFIGIAPIVIGSLFLTGLMFVMVYGMFMDVVAQAQTIGGSLLGDATAQDAVYAFFSIFGIYFLSATNPWWWAYLILSAAIALHMNLSKSDIKGSKEGLTFVILFLLVLCVVLLLVGESVLSGAMLVFFYISLMLSLILFQSLFLSLLWVLFAFLFRLPTIVRKAVEKERYERTMLQTRTIARDKRNGHTDKRKK